MRALSPRPSKPVASGTLRRALILVVSLAALFALLPLAGQARVTKTATYHEFLVHVESNSRTNNCESSEWNSQFAQCGGFSAPSGHSYAFNTAPVNVSWCPPGHACTIGN